MNEYKLFNTDGKTFFDFRSRPDTRCEGFTVSYLDDGTTVMSGDYGTLCWKRGSYKDYGFPAYDTNIGYFAEKICQWGVPQKIEEWNKEKAIKDVKEYWPEDEQKELKEFLDEVEYLEEYEEGEFYKLLYKHNFYDIEHIGIRYTEAFKFRYEVLKSVSGQIVAHIKKEE